MLDQNTDRMWYVIGAVIVGAALIFLMNGTFPELFASVGDTFEGKVTDVQEEIRQIGVDKNEEMTDGATPVLLPSVLTNGGFDDGLAGWAMNGVAQAEVVDGRTVAKIQKGQYSWVEHQNSGGLYQTRVLKQTGKVKVSFDARAVSGTAHAHVGFLNTRSAMRFSLTDQWKNYSFTASAVNVELFSANTFHIYFEDQAFYIDNVQIQPIEEAEVK